MSKVRCKRSRSARDRQEERTTAQRDRDRHGDVENVRAFTSEVLPANQRERFPDAFTQHADGTTLLRPSTTGAMPPDTTRQQGGERPGRNILRLSPSGGTETPVKTETVADFKIDKEPASSELGDHGASTRARSAWRGERDGAARTSGSRSSVPRWTSRCRIGGVVADCFWSDTAPEFSG